MTRVRPQWRATVRAGSVLGLAPGVLLHPGPPLASIDEMCPPLRNSACAALLFEGIAADVAQAQALIASGDVELQPAQEHGVAIPLAAVVSRSMWLHEIADAGTGGRTTYAPLNEGPGPALRFGFLNEAVVERLRFVHGHIGPQLSMALTAPVDLLPIAAAALAAGDDLHARVGMGSALLVEQVLLSGDEAAFLRDNSHFFLNVWMAACLCILSAAHAGDMLIAAGGNGRAFGIQLGRAPGVWITAPATVPFGPTAPTVSADTLRLPAIGDSALIDALGFGALALDAAPAHAAHFAPELVNELARTAAGLLVVEHPVLGRRIGVDTARVKVYGPPSVCLAAVDATGAQGLIGFGIAQHPDALYS